MLQVLSLHCSIYKSIFPLIEIEGTAWIGSASRYFNPCERIYSLTASTRLPLKSDRLPQSVMAESG